MPLCLPFRALKSVHVAVAKKTLRCRAVVARNGEIEGEVADKFTLLARSRRGNGTSRNAKELSERDIIFISCNTLLLLVDDPLFMLHRSCMVDCIDAQHHLDTHVTYPRS